jgi:hypothetical protein
MVRISIVMTILLLTALAGGVVAQEDDIGAISGFVYQDVNADGVCTADQDPGQQGINMQFVNRDTNVTLNQGTNQEGGYNVTGLQAGTWQITVNPGTGWRVLSQQTQQVVITTENPTFSEINFCIVRVSTTLPESGAPLSPGLLLAAGLGLLLLFSGAGLMARAWRNSL